MWSFGAGGSGGAVMALAPVSSSCGLCGGSTYDGLMVKAGILLSLPGPLNHSVFGKASGIIGLCLGLM